MYFAILSLFSWLPAPLASMATGVVALFFLFAILRLISFILNLIPFV